MGLRFQKRIKILPGVTINVSKSGLSTSLGTKGARMTFGHGKTRTTLGIPGTGISHTTIQSNRQASQPTEIATPTDQHPVPSWVEKVGNFLYKAVLWFLGFILFLIVLSQVIRYFVK